MLSVYDHGKHDQTAATLAGNARLHIRPRLKAIDSGHLTSTATSTLCEHINNIYFAKILKIFITAIKRRLAGINESIMKALY